MVFHHNNAPAHKAISVRQFFVKKQIIALDHPPYSPDLTPCDFWLFPRLKAVMKRTHYQGLSNKEAEKTQKKGFCQVFSWVARLNAKVY